MYFGSAISNREKVSAPGRRQRKAPLFSRARRYNDVADTVALNSSLNHLYNALGQLGGGVRNMLPSILKSVTDA
jgi:hypothetical protein